jgi:hypothetical protein
VSVVPPLPGNIGLSRLRVYESVAPDGLVGGTPHLHFACAEAYVAIGGSGSVQTLSAEGYAEHPLEPGVLVWFTPGVIHRLVNDHGLEILVIMQHARLPEAGDDLLTFPREVIEDPEAYAAARSLAPSDGTDAGDLERAHWRRDLAVEGFLELRRECDREGERALSAFYEAGARLVADTIDAWRSVWRSSLAAAERTGEQLELLASGRFDHLAEGTVHSLVPPPNRRLGMCGTLNVYLPEGVRA